MKIRAIIPSPILACLLVSGCALSTDESDHPVAPSSDSPRTDEQVGEGVGELNTSGIALRKCDNKAFPNTIAENQKFELICVDVACEHPGCNPGTMYLKQIRPLVSVVNNSPTQFGELSLWIDGQPVDRSRFWSTFAMSVLSLPQGATVDPSADIGDNTFTEVPTGAHYFHASMKDLFLELNDLAFKIGSRLTLTVIAKNVSVGLSVSAKFMINSTADPVGTSTYATPLTGPTISAPGNGRVWYTDVDPGAAVVPWNSQFLFREKVGGVWKTYAWAADSTAETVSQN